MEQNSLRTSHRRLNRLHDVVREKLKNEDGASIVMVMLVTAIISTIITVILLLVLINYYMKATDVKANKNFYDAESAVEEIRLGLSIEYENTFRNAYLKTLNDTTSNDTAAQKRAFATNFKDDLVKKFETVNGSKQYQINPAPGGTGTPIALSSFFRETKPEYEVDDEGNAHLKTGAEITTEDGKNMLVKTGDYVIFRNVSVRYLDDDNFETTITTDIKLEVPDVSFPGKSSIGDIYTYALIAQDHVETSGTAGIEIIGNTLFGSGYNQTADNQFNNTNVNFSPNEGDNYAIWGIPTTIKNNSINMNGMELWAEDIVLDNGTFNTNDDSKLYLHDDLVLGQSSHSKLSGSFYAYGNSNSALQSKVANEEKNAETHELTDIANAFRTAVAADPAQFSSSIIINGTGSTLDLSGLSSLSIAGTSYVDLKKGNGGTNPIPDPNDETTQYLAQNAENATGVMMGNSISLKSDQRAYLVPSEAFGVGYKDGGLNPMTKDQYTRLCAQIREKKGYAEGATIPVEDFVSLDTPLTLLGGDTLRSVGVVGAKSVFYQVTGGNMCYYFLTFDNETNAAKYFQRYMEYTKDGKRQGNAERLADNLDRYLNGGYNLSKQAGTGSAEFYFNGNVVTDDVTSIEGIRTITMGYTNVKDQAEKDKIAEQEAEYQNRFFALKKKAVKSYDGLTDTEKNNGLFYNIINDQNVKSESWSEENKKKRIGYLLLGINDYTHEPLNDDPIIFVDQATGAGAIITKKDLYRNSVPAGKSGDTIDNLWSQLKAFGGKSMNLIICTGNVDLRKQRANEDRNNTFFGGHSNTFEGLIFVGGSIIIDQGMTIKSAPDEVITALNARPKKPNTDEYFTAADFFVDADYYRMGGISTVDASTEETDDTDQKLAIDYITYENWSRE